MSPSPRMQDAFGRRRFPLGAEDEGPGGAVAALCARLGISTDVLVPGRRYLLVTASARPDARPAVAVFATEEDARAAFVRFRRAEPGDGPSAELAELRADGAVRRLCWFGVARPTRPDHRPSGRRRSGVRSALLRMMGIA
ncbi:MAG: hypothetical protein M3326_11305 [Actinomycetota bacterium]|nr:hypothetical protein [Actinomycetota bacterium]